MNNATTKLMIDRHSAREFNSDFKISDLNIMNIIEAGRMSPSAYGLHNLRIINLSKSKFRDSLNEIFYYQKNFSTASNYFLFVTDSGTKLKNETIKLSAKLMIGDIENDMKAMRYIANFEGGYDKKFKGNEPLADQWSSKTAYVATGIITVAAAELDIDTCIMEGFDQPKLESILREANIIGSDEKIYVGMALGRIHSNAEFKNPKLKRDIKEFYTEVK